MKVAITCDYLLSRTHYTEVIEVVLELFPEAQIYTFAHKAGGILGRVEQRIIKSTHLSNIVDSEKTFYEQSAKLPFLASNLFVSCEYDLIICISSGLSQGFKKCDRSKLFVYLYDLGFEGKVKKSFLQKLTYPFLINYFIRTLKKADFVWVSRPDLQADLKKYLGEVEVVAPPFKISDYSLFPSDMFKHHFYLIETLGLDDKMARELIAYMNQNNYEFQFIGPDYHLKEIKELYKDKPNMFFGNRCSGEHAPILAACKQFISFNDLEFPKLTLAALATGRSVVINQKQTAWVNGNGIYSVSSFDMSELDKVLKKAETEIEQLEGQKLRGLIHDYHEIKFKSRLKRFLEKL